jgi:AbrB family looped-hinge helix DNA binding protein
MTTITLSSNGRITIPKSVRNAFQLQPGDKLEVILSSQNEIILRPAAKTVNDVFGLLAQYKKKEPVPVEKLGF